MFTKNEHKILAYLFENPTQKINIRSLAKKINISHTSIFNSLNNLSKYLNLEKTNIQTQISLNLDNEKTILEKRLYNIKQIYESNLIKYLEDIYEIPKAIVLFGSFSFGKDYEDSDIDIAIYSNLEIKKINLTKYEKILRRKIEIFIVNKNTPKSLLKSIYNGIILRGNIS